MKGRMVRQFGSMFVRRQVIVACLRGSLLALPALSVGLCARPAAAQDKKELSKARVQFQRAIELEQAGNYSTALEQFRDVGQVRMTPQVRFHIATCEEKLGRLVTALGGYQLAFADADGVGEDFKAEVTVAVTRLQASIPKLVIQRGTGAEAAEIQLDGVALGASSVGVPVPLDPGPHSVSAKAPGALPFSQTVTIAENEQKSIDVSLAPEPEEARPTVIVGPPGPSEKTNPRLVPYVIGGVGVASLIASGVFIGLRQAAIGEVRDGCRDGDNGCDPALKDVAERGQTYEYAAIGLGVAGLAAVGVGVALVFTIGQDQTVTAKPAKPGSADTPRSKQTSRLTLTPAGITLAGTFD